jgi:putative ABC transport system ATP-binding protein
MVAGPTPVAAQTRGQPVPAIVLQGVTRVYGEQVSEVRALDGIDCVVETGEFVALMGPSGAGKSTCLNILGCLDRPSSGSYLLDGVDVGSLSRHQKALIRRHFVGFIFQGFNLLNRTTALENVELPLVYRGEKSRKRKALAREALALVGLSGRENHTPGELSGGQQQRVAIARAIVTGPRLVLADEPTGNLDTATGEEVMQLLVRLNTEHALTVIMVTHESEIAAYAGREIHFRDGRIASDQMRAGH